MAGTLRKIEPFHGPVSPDPNWERMGATPWGQQLYREVSHRARGVPMRDEEGNRVYQRTPNGDKSYARNRPERYTLERVFYLESEGNGNVRKVAYRPPTPEEIAEAERQGKIESMMAQLAETFVDADISPADLVASLRERPYTPQSEIDEPVETDELDEPSEILAEPTESVVDEPESDLDEPDEEEVVDETEIDETIPEPGGDL